MYSYPVTQRQVKATGSTKFSVFGVFKIQSAKWRVGAGISLYCTQSMPMSSKRKALTGGNCAIILNAATYRTGLCDTMRSYKLGCWRLCWKCTPDDLQNTASHEYKEKTKVSKRLYMRRPIKSLSNKEKVNPFQYIKETEKNSKTIAPIHCHRQLGKKTALLSYLIYWTLSIASTEDILLLLKGRWTTNGIN